MAPEEHATISFKALSRARRTLEDFFLSYFPYHGLGTQDFFKFLDILTYVEATIYGLDEDNEALACQGAAEPGPDFAGRREALLGVLRARGLLTPALLEELERGARYWRREREFARHMAAPGPAALTLEDVLATSADKSFDYRVLHLLLYGLCGTPPDPALLAFLRLDELLVDIGDDLLDYESDVERSSFNVYRGFVRCVGREGAALALAAHISGLERRRAEALSRLPPEHQAHVARRHRQAAALPGSGDWVIPDPIPDEAAYRAQCAAG